MEYRGPTFPSIMRYLLSIQHFGKMLWITDACCDAFFKCISSNLLRAQTISRFGSECVGVRVMQCNDPLVDVALSYLYFWQPFSHSIFYFEFRSKCSDDDTTHKRFEYITTCIYAISNRRNQNECGHKTPRDSNFRSQSLKYRRRVLHCHHLRISFIRKTTTPQLRACAHSYSWCKYFVTLIFINSCDADTSTLNCTFLFICSELKWQ